jgi:hypothetical protein
MPADAQSTLKDSSFCKYAAMNFTRSFMGAVSFHGIHQHAGVLLPMLPVCFATYPAGPHRDFA